MRKPFLWKSRKAWYVRVEVDGKLKLVKLGDTKKVAYDRWQAMRRMAEVEGGLVQRTVSDLIDMYATDLASRLDRGELSKLHVDFKLGFLAEFQSVVGDNLLASDLKPYHVYEWIESQATRWGQTTRSDAAASIKAAIKWAHSRGYISRDPIESVAIGRGESRDFVVDDHCYQSLLGGWKQLRKSGAAFRLLLIVLRLTGCRPSEVLTVRVDQVAADHSTWTLEQHKTRKKKKRPRVIYLSPCLQTITRIAMQGRKSGELFRRVDGKAWTYAEVRTNFTRLRNRANVDSQCVLYSFRHTWITDALVAGVDIATVAEMAGTSVQMIDRKYGHLCKHKEHMKAAALQVAKSRCGGM